MTKKFVNDSLSLIDTATMDGSSIEEIGAALCKLKAVTEYLSKTESELKKSYLDKSEAAQIVFDPETGYKVHAFVGSSSSWDVKNVELTLKELSQGDKFVEIVNVVEKKAEKALDEKTMLAIKQHKHSQPTAETVKVSRMSKQDHLSLL